MEFNNLKTALFPYQEELDLDNEQRFDGLENNIRAGYISLADLKLEFRTALKDESFDWVKIATESSLLISASSYEPKEIANYVKSILKDFLYPEEALTTAQVEQLNKDVVSLLEKHSENEGWMFSYDLHDLLRQKKEYKDLEYFNLWKVETFDSVVERKPIVEKYQEIGYLRYNSNKTFDHYGIINQS